MTTTLLLCLPFAACGPSATAPLPERSPETRVVHFSSNFPAPVTDLTVVERTAATLSLRWTQVDDGFGRPAEYRVRYAAPPIRWADAATGCEEHILGTDIGDDITCTITGLSSRTTYDVQLASFRYDATAWGDVAFSNVVSTRTADPQGIWISPGALAALPTSGVEWERLLEDAARDPGRADIADQDSRHDVYTLAAALVCARTGRFCAKARAQILDAIGTENRGRWLAVGRNLGAYVIAADVMGLHDDGDPTSDGTRVSEWMHAWMTRRLPDNITGELRPIEPFASPANASAQEGFVFAALAAYLHDGAALDRAWDAFRTYACDPEAPDRESILLGKILADGWSDPARPCAVAPAGATLVVPGGRPGAGTAHRLDGALAGDMRRGGAYQWPPRYTQYPWVGLEGFVPAAVVLQQAGYPAFEVADQAVRRSVDYLWFLREDTGDRRWFDGERGRHVVQIVNHVYGTSYPVDRPTGAGRTVGYTGWTHP